MKIRRSFYVPAIVFEAELDAEAISVYCFLCSCANKQCVAYPSVPTIARCCRMSENTVRKRIKALEEKQLIRVTTEYRQLSNGKYRQTSNRYTILHAVKGETVSASTSSLRQVQGVPSMDGGEIDNSKNLTEDLSLCPYNGAKDSIFEDILIKTGIYGYENDDFSAAVIGALRHMYYAPYITVNGKTILQEQARDHMQSLRADHIDYVLEQLQNHENAVIAGENYLVSCIYNSIADMAIENIKAYG